MLFILLNSVKKAFRLDQIFFIQGIVAFLFLLLIAVVIKQMYFTNVFFNQIFRFNFSSYACAFNIFNYIFTVHRTFILTALRTSASVSSYSESEFQNNVK